MASSRSQHIHSLSVFNGVVHVVRPESLYALRFVAGDKKGFELRIHLPDNFPVAKPNLQCVCIDDNSAVLRHPWLDEQGHVVGAPGLVHYTMHAELGRLVQVIRRELERSPPTILSRSNNDNNNSVNRNEKSGTFDLASNKTLTSPFVAPRLPLEDEQAISSIVSRLKLSELPESELKLLLHNDKDKVAIRALIGLEQLENLRKGFDEKRGQLSRHILDINKGNHELEKDLREREESLRQKLDVLRQTQASTHDSVMETRNACSNSELLRQLKVCEENDELESDRVKKAFIDGQLDAQAFVDDFVKINKRMQVRRAKKTQMVKQGSNL